MKLSFLFAAAALLAATPALAEGQPGMTGMGHMKGTHVMAFTVAAVDARTGIVEGTSGVLSLKLHFPPSSLDVVKPGDQLQVMLAFSK